MAGKFKITLNEINENPAHAEFLERCSITGMPYKVQERLLDTIEKKTGMQDLCYKVTKILVLVSSPVLVLIKCDGKWQAFAVGKDWKRVNEIKGVMPGFYIFTRDVDMTILDTTSTDLYCAIIKNADDEALQNGLAILPIDYFDALEWRLTVAQKLYDDGVIFYQGGF